MKRIVSFIYKKIYEAQNGAFYNQSTYEHYSGYRKALTDVLNFIKGLGRGG